MTLPPCSCVHRAQGQHRHLLVEESRQRGRAAHLDPPRDPLPLAVLLPLAVQPDLVRDPAAVAAAVRQHELGRPLVVLVARLVRAEPALALVLAVALGQLLLRAAVALRGSDALPLLLGRRARRALRGRFAFIGKRRGGRSGGRFALALGRRPRRRVRVGVGVVRVGELVDLVLGAVLLALALALALARLALPLRLLLDARSRRAHLAREPLLRCGDGGGGALGRRREARRERRRVVLAPLLVRPAVLLLRADRLLLPLRNLLALRPRSRCALAPGAAALRGVAPGGTLRAGRTELASLDGGGAREGGCGALVVSLGDDLGLGALGAGAASGGRGGPDEAVVDAGVGRAVGVVGQVVGGCGIGAGARGCRRGGG